MVFHDANHNWKNNVKCKVRCNHGFLEQQFVCCWNIYIYSSVGKGNELHFTEICFLQYLNLVQLKLQADNY